MKLPPFVQFQADLIRWAGTHFPECQSAMAEKMDDHEFCMKCLGAIFRRRAATDPGWLFRTVERRPEEIMLLSKWIRGAEVAGVTFPPPALGWRKWMACVAMWA